MLNCDSDNVFLDLMSTCGWSRMTSPALTPLLSIQWTASLVCWMDSPFLSYRHIWTDFQSKKAPDGVLFWRQKWLWGWEKPWVAFLDPVRTCGWSRVTAPALIPLYLICFPHVKLLAGNSSFRRTAWECVHQYSLLNWCWDLNVKTSRLRLKQSALMP